MSLPTARLLIAGLLALMLGACASSRSLDGSLADIGAGAQLSSALFTDRSYDYSNVDVTIFEGRLMLTGSMFTEDGKAQLIANANAIDNVSEVIDEILISEKTPFRQGLEDSRIDQALRFKLIAADDVESTRYKISVSDGVIYLIGAAKDEAERTRAIMIAETISGAQKTINHVKLRAPGDA